jgi:hypothetical protein
MALRFALARPPISYAKDDFAFVLRSVRVGRIPQTYEEENHKFFSVCTFTFRYDSSLPYF